MRSYCVKCRKKVEAVNLKQIQLKDGRYTTVGECPDCGTKVFRVGRSPVGGSDWWLEEVERIEWEALSSKDIPRWVKSFIRNHQVEALGRLDNLYGEHMRTGNEVAYHVKGKRYSYKVVFRDWGQHNTDTDVYRREREWWQERRNTDDE